MARASKVQVRNKLLKSIIGSTDRSRIVGVGVDPGKDFHQIVLFDFTGKMLGRSFTINSLLSGYEKLKKRIHSTCRRIKAQKVIFGIEHVHTCIENLARYLHEDFGDVFFINPYSTSTNRTQKMLFGIKTDEVDAASIGDLLMRGECYPYNLREGIYLELQEKVYWLEKKLSMSAKIKNQVMTHVRIVYPGLDSKHEGNVPLYTYTFMTQTSRLIFDLLRSPQEFAAMEPKEFMGLTRGHIYEMKIDKSRTIVNYFKKLLPPHERIFPIYQELIQRDIAFLAHLEKDIRETQERVVHLAKQTPARVLFGQVKGLSDNLIASYIACVGNVRRFKKAKQIYSFAGLSPKLLTSGSNISKEKGIKRAGNKYLRTILFRMAVFVATHSPYFREYYRRIRKKKSGRESFVAVANKLNRVLFAMMKRQEPFNPPAAGSPGTCVGEKPVRVKGNARVSK